MGDLPALRERLAAELAGLGDSALGAAELERRTTVALATYESAASALSARRRSAAAVLDRKVTELMQGLGMRGGVFETRIDTATPLARSEHGADDIEFKVSANPGQPTRPLAKTASGGELSRISLALQVATLEATHLPCLVFDEVDAGVGGAVAEMVGRQLRALAATGQVLCVTHLPQVASQADRQVRVTKRTDRRIDPHRARDARWGRARRRTGQDARRCERHGSRTGAREGNAGIGPGPRFAPRCQRFRARFGQCSRTQRP